MYKLFNTYSIDGVVEQKNIIRLADNAGIPFDPANRDYAEY
jgi:hypothetical protein